MAAHYKHIVVATPGDRAVTMTHNTNGYSDIKGYAPVGEYAPIPVYYTFVGAGFYADSQHPVLKWASKDAFADVLYRHLYTAEQRDQFYAYLDIAYNTLRTTDDNELLKDGRFRVNGELLYVRNMYIYSADKVQSLGEHDVQYFSRQVTDVHATTTHIKNMTRSACYSRADINQLIRIRYNNAPPPEIAQLQANNCNGLPNIPDIADVQATVHKAIGSVAPAKLSRLKSTANMRRAGVINTEGTCVNIATLMMFADIPEIYHECWLAHDRLKKEIPAHSDKDTAKMLTERHAQSKFPIFPYIIAASVAYLNNRSNLKGYRDTEYRTFLKLTDYAVQYCNSHDRWTATTRNSYRYEYTVDKTKMEYKNNAGTNTTTATIVALCDLYRQFPDNPNIRILLQPLDHGKHGIETRMRIHIPSPYTDSFVEDYLKNAKTRQQYAMFIAASNTSAPYPIRVRNDRTNTDYILISYIIVLHKHSHAVYVNMAMRERVDNSSSNTTPSAMMATLNRYGTAFDDVDTSLLGANRQSLMSAQVLLYRRCDTMPSQTI